MKVQFLNKVLLEVMSSKKHCSNRESSNTIDFILRFKNLRKTHEENRVNMCQVNIHV